MVKRVLIVDDDELLGKSLQKLLVRRGIEAEHREDPHSVLFALRKKEFDLALIDLNMPALNGIDLAGLIMEEHPLISTIIMTGAGSVEDYTRAQAAGIRDFIHKPFKFDMFMRMIKDIDSAPPGSGGTISRTLGRQL